MATGSRVVGAGLPRTGTSSLRHAFEQLLGGPCHHMSAIPGHPFDLGEGWDLALAGGTPDWNALLDGFVGAVDWPASLFWRELADAYPDALVLLSLRDSAQSWLESVEATFLPLARMSAAPDWKEGRGLVGCLERFAGSERWDDAQTLLDAHDRHNAAVRAAVPRSRLLEWHATEGWEPLYRALGVPVPVTPFPWRSRREEWK
jgi:hypothetical protein